MSTSPHPDQPRFLDYTRPLPPLIGALLLVALGTGLIKRSPCPKSQDRSDHNPVDENRSLITTDIRADKLHARTGLIKAG